MSYGDWACGSLSSLAFVETTARSFGGLLIPLVPFQTTGAEEASDRVTETRGALSEEVTQAQTAPLIVSVDSKGYAAVVGAKWGVQKSAPVWLYRRHEVRKSLCRE